VFAEKWKDFSSLIKQQPPVNPLENEMVLELVKAPQLVVSTAVNGKAAVIVLETELKTTTVCCQTSVTVPHTRIWCLEGFEVP
jgi:hypothetical protein